MTKKNNNYINNSIWILAEKASRIISGILVGVLVARFLGKEQFGIISYALSVISIFTVFSTLGIEVPPEAFQASYSIFEAKKSA